MADRKSRKDQKSKFKFVEMFAIQNEEDLDKLDSPKFVTTNFFGQRYLHQIARVVTEEYEEETAEVERYENGEPIFKKVKKTREKMGEKGGWIEKMENLSQDGECWVGDNAVVCGFAYVSDDAQIRDRAEVGENARVSENAEVSGNAAVCGCAYVHGDAYITGKRRIAVDGSAEVLGRMLGNTTASGHAYVGEDAEMMDDASVEDHGMFLSGYMRDDAVVDGNSIVARSSEDPNNRPMMRKGSEVGGEAVVMGGEIEKSSVKDLAMVSATVDKSKVSGHAVLWNSAEDGRYTISESTVEGNFHHNWLVAGGSKEASIKDCKIGGNVFIRGGTRLNKSNFAGTVFWMGSANNSFVSDAMRPFCLGAGTSGTIVDCDIGGGIVASQIIDSMALRGVIWNPNGKVSNSHVTGVIVGGSRTTGSDVTGVARGTVSSASVDGVVVGECLGGSVDHAGLQVVGGATGRLVKLKGGGAAHALVGCPKNGLESAVEYLENQLARIEAEQKALESDKEDAQRELEAGDEDAKKRIEEIEKEEEKFQKKLDAAQKKLEEAREQEAKDLAMQAEREQAEEEAEERRQKSLQAAMDSVETKGVEGVADNGGRKNPRAK